MPRLQVAKSFLTREAWERWVKRQESLAANEYLRLNNENIARTIESCLLATERELEDVITATKEPILVRLVSQVLLTELRNGTYKYTDKFLDRVIGRSRIHLELNQPQKLKRVKIDFRTFCERASYPIPYDKQVEMMEFGINKTGPRMILGSRGYGKTDYVVILGLAYAIYKDFIDGLENPEFYHRTFLVITKSDERNASILAEIAKASEANGVTFEKKSASSLRVEGLKGKDHSVSALTIGSTAIRGRHPHTIVLDDPVTEEDVSEATRKRVQRVYNELSKLTPHILIIGQPVHKFDLYETLRPFLNKMEVPHGTIPELDHDLTAQRLAGVSEESIQASYFLKVVSETGNPLEGISYLDEFPDGSSVAFIDPSFEGGDYTAISVVKAHFDGVAVFGKVWKKAWFHCIDDIAALVVDKKIQRVCFETNSLGEQPVVLLRSQLKCGVVGKKSLGNKHARIMALGPFARHIHLARSSDRAYIDQVVKYEYGSKNDDAPDSLASALEWIGLIRGLR